MASFAAGAVSSFGEHGARSNSCRFKFGKGPQREPPTAMTISRTGLQGTIKSKLDIYGASNTWMATSKVWPGKTTEMKDWRERDSYGASPSYLRGHASLASSSFSGLTVGTFRSKGGVSDATMRATDHPLTWARQRRSREALQRRSREGLVGAMQEGKDSLDSPLTRSWSASSRPGGSAARGRRSCSTFGIDPGFVATPLGSRPGSRSGSRPDSRAGSRPATPAAVVDDGARGSVISKDKQSGRRPPWRPPSNDPYAREQTG